MGEALFSGIMPSDYCGINRFQICAKVEELQDINQPINESSLEAGIQYVTL